MKKINLMDLVINMNPNKKIHLKLLKNKKYIDDGVHTAGSIVVNIINMNVNDGQVLRMGKDPKIKNCLLIHWNEYNKNY